MTKIDPYELLDQIDNASKIAADRLVCMCSEGDIVAWLERMLKRTASLKRYIKQLERENEQRDI